MQSTSPINQTSYSFAPIAPEEISNSGTTLDLAPFFPHPIRRTTSGLRELENAPLPLLRTESKQNSFLQMTLENSDSALQRIKDIALAKLDERHISLDAMGIALVTGGSDGRGEKTGRFSPVDLMILTPEEPDEAQQPDLFLTIETVKQIFQETCLRELIAPDIEIKVIGENAKEPINVRVLSKSKKVMPSLPLDTQLIVGSNDSFALYKKKFADEWYQRKVKLSSFQHEFVRIEQHNLDRQLKGYPLGTDVINGKLTFNPDPHTAQERLIRGPKYGATRFLQYCVTKRIVQHIQELSSQQDVYQFLKDLPRGTIARICFLKERDLLPFNDQDIQLFKETYSTLLFWYSVLQDKAERKPPQETEVSVAVPPTSLQAILQNAQSLGERILEGCR